MSALDDLILRVEQQERDLRFERMDLGIAWDLGLLLRRLAVAKSFPLVIDIALGEQRVFHAALPGTSPHNGRWIERKKRTVREWQASSYGVGLRFPVLDPPYSLESAPWIDVREYSGSGGGFPINVTGAGFVGTIAVSGLRHDLDHEFIVGAVGSFLADGS